MNKRAILFSVLIGLVAAVEIAQSATLHVNKCDNFCGGSKINPFGKAGTCKDCCLEKGFYGGGECGDFLYRHCRCVLNPPGNAAGMQPGGGAGWAAVPGYPGYPGQYPQQPLG